MPAAKKKGPKDNGNMPYFGKVGVRLACQHQFGGVREPQWWTLKPYWDFLGYVASERDGQKRSFQTTRQWTESSHFIGLLGETVFALEYGVSLDVVLRIEGDAGMDFNNIDVKTATYWRDPYLKHPPTSKHWPQWFALVALDMDMQRGKLCGMASEQMVREAPLKDWGNGPQHSLGPADLLNSVPMDICRFCGGRRVTSAASGGGEAS